ncbi:TetR/AcrR family transcriptional regulator [Rhodococcus sp. 1R11]|uniref:TetR/AcrR family transcriptional regulator n=1 Tax=Rhodococcus sp. 1R11 TaxID=2559614 RepID=UPI00107240AF|nr:TetR/AcrR family transcriptional regulator [Rhodococcus sp. 1R11]TFI44821.1 TetR/AcrR family transcriptional regulator [Rhodococcus sp. 1R11]
MARPRKFIEADVIASAGEQFMIAGYGGTTLDDLVKATGLGKQSLYNAFGGKREVFLKALTAEATEAVAAVDDALANASSTPVEKIRAQMLKLAIALSTGHSFGSLFITATMEMAQRDSDVANTALSAYTALRDTYRRCLADAQAIGQIDSDVDAGTLAAYFVAVTRGMEVLGNAGVDRAELTGIALASLRALPMTGDGDCMSTP